MGGSKNERGLPVSAVAETIKKNIEKEVNKILSKAAVLEYIGHRVERMSVIEKGNTKILLMDQTRIVVPLKMRKKLLEREHLAHSRVTRMSDSITAKYFWPGIKADVKRMVEACEPTRGSKTDWRWGM